MSIATNLAKLGLGVNTQGVVAAEKGGTGTTSGSASGGYITMSQPGYVVPNVGFSRYYPPKSLTLSGITASTSAVSSTDFTFDLLKNSSVFNTYTISAGQNIFASVAITGLSLVTTDYLTINVTSGSAYDFRVNLQYA
jgi:hypothetical protein